MSGISKIINAGIKYTKNGYRLLSKETVAADNFVCQKSLLPQDFSTVDILKVEADFGNRISTVLSFKNSDGNLVKRILTKNDSKGKPVSQLIREYKTNGDVRFSRTERKVDNVLTQTDREAFYTYKLSNGQNGMKRTKLETFPRADGSRYEEQLYEDWYPLSKIYLKTSAVRLPNGKLVEKNINSSFKNIECFAEDPYLYIRNYDKKDFAQSASWHAQELQNVQNSLGSFRIKKIKGSAQAYYSDLTRMVTVDSSKGTKADLVDTINHEYRHKYQSNLMNKYLLKFWNVLFRKKTLDEEEVNLVKNLYKGQLVYPAGRFSYKRYYNNFLEVDAREAGKKAQNEYVYYSNKLAKIFSMPKEMVYARTSEEQVNDTLSKFISNALKNGQVHTINIFDAAKLNS